MSRELYYPEQSYHHSQDLYNYLLLLSYLPRVEQCRALD